MQNYTQLVERIAKGAGLSVQDVERRIEAKRAKLSGLISKEGAAQVVASELGVSFEKEKMKVSELMSGMRRVNITGKIIQMFPVKSYDKNGRSGKIGAFVLADDTGNVRTVLWDMNHISLIEQGKIKQGDFVEIVNSAVRNNEIHLTGFSDIKLSNEVIENIVTEKAVSEKSIKNFVPGESVEMRAIIVQAFEPRFFLVCPACGKKLTDLGECLEHGKVSGEKRALLSIVLDDGTETIRAVLFSEQIKKFIQKEELEGDFTAKRKELLGKEMIFSGNVRKSKLYDNLEFFVQDSKEVDINSLIERLEKA